VTVNVRVIVFIATVGFIWRTPLSPAAPQRPNILWITCEDISPHVRCFGDATAVTPNLDRLATQSVRYTRAFAPIGVCAPSRSTLITGTFAPSIGTHHMRCTGNLPATVRCFPEYLRRAGYYCTNNVKTDYNFAHRPESWDASNAKAHWRNRKGDQPFFAVFNFTSCHESQIRLAEAEYRKRIAGFTPAEIHDPAKIQIPPYHPDTQEVRRDWARYADMITFMDKQVGQVLRQLDDDGLAGNTIVFFFSDHGAGMPRSKRWLYDSSLHVPMMIRFPRTCASLAPATPNETCDRLVSFVDFGPTVLSLAGVEVPKHMQGVPFLGDQAGKPRQYIHGFRDRMDERTDMLRAVRDDRYKYIRNYHPELPWFHDQHISYMYEMPTMRVWQRLADEGKLTGPQAVFMAKEKPAEELYDLQADPHEIRNLATSTEHQATLKRLRDECRRWQESILDLGVLPEPILRTRFGGKPEYDGARSPGFPWRRIAEAAEVAASRDPDQLAHLGGLLNDEDPAIRWWAATGFGNRGSKAIDHLPALRLALNDASPAVRVAAADALIRLGQPDEARKALYGAMKDPNEWVRLHATQILDRINDQSTEAKAIWASAVKDKNQYVVRVAKHARGEP
jgi:uncharacterized sulfatase